MIDPESQIERGTVGQSVEAIVSSLPNRVALLRRAVLASDLAIEVRGSAALILAMHEATDAMPDLLILEREGSWYAGELLAHLKKHGDINPYG
jgi:hypothetical protein